MSLTYKPKKISKRSKHGFLYRSSTRNGRKILMNRISKKRHRIT